MKRLHGAGVPFLAGTDTPAGVGVLPGFSLHQELQRFVDAGFTPLEALQTATINPAKFLDRLADFGTVEKGKVADLVLLDANPLDDIRNTRKIAAVVSNGRYYAREKLDRILADVETYAGGWVGFETRSRWRILLWAILLIALTPFLAWFLYPVATRWLLSGPRLRALINAQPEYLTMNWDEAVSRRPGHLTLKNLSIRASDPNVQWIIRLASAEVEFSMSALAKSTFRATSLRGTGLSFYLRNKIKPEAVKAANTSVLPPIPGFSDPPLRSPDDRMPPPDPRAWLIDVRTIAIDHFDDIWVDAYHFEGGARVDGAFSLRPALLAQIGPARLTFEKGEVRIGKAKDGIAVAGTVTATFDPFEPLKYPDAKVFAVVTAEVKLEGSFQKLQSLQHLFQTVGTRLGGGVGKATITAAIDHGIAKGSIQALVKDAVVQLETYKLQGTADVRVNIPKWNLMSGPIDVSGTSIALSDMREFGSKDPKRWAGRFDIPSSKINVTTTATVEAKVQDARPLLAVLGSPLPGWTKPLVNLKNLVGGARATLGPSVVRIRGLDMKGGSFHIQGNYVREKGRTDGAFLIESGILSVGVELDGKKTKVRPLFAKKWYAKQGKDDGGGAKASAGGK